MAENQPTPKPDTAEQQNIDSYEVELCVPECLIRSIAASAGAANPVTGEFAFDENVRNAIGMVLLKYIKLVTRNY